MFRKLSLCIAMLLIAAMCLAQDTKENKTKDEPETVKVDMKDLRAGIIDISTAKLFEGNTPKVEVQLEKSMLQLLRAASEQNDPDFADLIDKIDLVKVQVFNNVKAKSEKVSGNIENLLTKLKDDEGWSSMVRVREDSEKVDILVHNTSSHITGVALFVQESNEIVFINIAGKMDSEEFGKKVGSLVSKFASGNLDISQLGALLNKSKGKQGEPAKSKPKALIVKGVVKEAKSGRAIVGAMINKSTDGPNPAGSWKTGEGGAYRIEMDRGQQIIIAGAPGYKNKKAMITEDMLKSGGDIVINFELEPAE